MRVILNLLILSILVGVLRGQICGFQTTCVPPSDSAYASWQMFNGSQKHTGRQVMKGNFIGGRYIKWTYTTGDWVISSPAIGDINNDGRIEIVVGSWDGKVYALRGTNGTVLWSYTTGDIVVSSPAIGDINGDGNVEIVVGSHDLKVYALRGTDGSLLWSFTTEGFVESSPAIGNINEDSLIEIVVGSSDYKVYALRGTDGSLIWSFTTGGNVYSSPAIGDINNDGYIEVVVGSYDNKVYALRGFDGSLIWYYTTGYPVISSPVIGDINNDGNTEIVIGCDDNEICVLHGTDGSLVWSYTTGGWVISSPAIGDINNDGQVEILAGSTDSTIYALRGTNGSLLWFYDIGGTYSLTEDVILADVDPSSGMEIITHGGHTHTYALSSSGAYLWQIYSVFHQRSLSAGDVDGDGCVEIVAVGKGSPMIAVIDDIFNENGCGYLGSDVSKTEDLKSPYVKIYTIDGKRIYQGHYKNFKPERKGIYFVVFKGGVRKIILPKAF